MRLFIFCLISLTLVSCSLKQPAVKEKTPAEDEAFEVQTIVLTKEIESKKPSTPEALFTYPLLTFGDGPKLTGIIGSENPLAIIEIVEQGFIAGAGEEICGYLVTSISNGRVILKKGGRKITLGLTASPRAISFEQANIFDAVRALAQKINLNLIITSNSQLPIKRITLNLRSLDPLPAIEYILESNGYSFQKEENTLLISTLANDLKTSAYQLKLKELELKYLSAQKSAEILNKIYPEISAAAGNSSDSLVLKGKTGEIAAAAQLIASLDRPKPQVLIESKIIEISESGISQLGFSWGKDTGTFKFSIDQGGGVIPAIENLQITLNSLITDGKAKIIANPKITTVDNQEALINIGSKIPYAVPVSNSSGSSVSWTVQYLDAGVNLKITPCVGKDKLITTKIHPEVSTISEWRTTAAGDFPVISTRNADATVQVKDGETIAIGGLINELERKNISKLPVLGYIPVLGLPFQKITDEKTKTEIVFLITVKLL